LTEIFGLPGLSGQPEFIGGSMYTNKRILKTVFFLFLLCCFIVSCENSTGDDQNKPEDIKTGKVTFFNESSYSIKIHRDSFSGPVLLELSAGGSKKIDVRISDTHGFGTTFSIEYLYQINDAFDTDSGAIFASGLDFNVQINRVIEEDKSYTVQIPQPENLEFRSAFIKVLNAHNLPIEVRDVGRILQQAGNSQYPIASGKTGVYRLPSLPAEGELLQTYMVVVTTAEFPIPDFTAKNGFIYDFTYNGSSVIKTGEQSIVFH
jgi:hypothetical protein